MLMVITEVLATIQLQKFLTIMTIIMFTIMTIIMITIMEIRNMLMNLQSLSCQKRRSLFRPEHTTTLMSQVHIFMFLVTFL